MVVDVQDGWSGSSNFPVLEAFCASKISWIATDARSSGVGGSTAKNRRHHIVTALDGCSTSREDEGIKGILTRSQWSWCGEPSIVRYEV